MITRKQKEVLDFIADYQKRKGYAPVLEDVRKKFKLASVSTAHFHVSKLRDSGYLSKEENKPRSIETLGRETMVKIPLLGTISAGHPIEAIQNKEMIAVPKNKVPSSSEVYALRVVGTSMIDENINDGDVVLVRRQETAENGQKVVALIDNHEATLKKFYKERGHIRLQPANKNMEPLIFRNGRDFSIQGIVLDVIRDGGFMSPVEIYPDAKLLNRERKVKNREAKERARGGTKFQKETFAVAQASGIEKFVDKIICGDSEEILRKIPTGSIDIIIFPPCRFRLDYKDSNGKVYRNEYFKK